MSGYVPPRKANHLCYFISVRQSYGVSSSLLWNTERKMPNRLQWDLTEVTQEIPNVSSLEGLISNSPSLSSVLTHWGLLGAFWHLSVWKSFPVTCIQSTHTVCFSRVPSESTRNVVPLCPPHPFFSFLHPLPSGNLLFLLCIYDSVSGSLCLFICFVL